MIFIFLFLSLASNNMAQTQNFKSVDGADLKTRWERALSEARSEHPRSPSWLGYSFDVRHGVGVEIMPEPGVENQNLGLFFLYDPEVNAVRKFGVYNLDVERRYGHPVYWLGHAESRASLDLLKGMVETQAGNPMSAQLLEAVSMHEGREADAVLEEVARKYAGRTERDSAVYWLNERATACRPFKDLPDNVPALSKIAGDEQESLPLRRRAAQALGLCADPAGLRALAALYHKAKDPEVKRLILGGAFNKVNDTSVALLLEVAAGETDPQVRREAYEWLAEKTANRIAWNMQPGLRLFADDRIGEAESARLKQMSRLGGEEAVSLLIKTAETDPQIGVRKAAAVQLGRIGGERALEFFRKVLTEKVRGVPASASLD